MCLIRNNLAVAQQHYCEPGTWPVIDVCFSTFPIICGAIEGGKLREYMDVNRCRNSYGNGYEDKLPIIKNYKQCFYFNCFRTVIGDHLEGVQAMMISSNTSK